MGPGMETGAGGALQVGRIIVGRQSAGVLRLTGGGMRLYSNAVQKALDRIPRPRPAWHGGCAEVACVNAFVKAGISTNSGRFVAIGVRGFSAVKPACESCKVFPPMFGVERDPMYENFYATVNRIRHCYAGVDIYMTACRYTTSCLSILEHKFDDVLSKKVYEIALRYWIHGSATPAELTESLEISWRLTETISRDTEEGNTKYHAVRALICCLYSEILDDDGGEFDAVENICLFVQFTIAAIGWDDGIEANLHKYFPLLNASSPRRL